MSSTNQNIIPKDCSYGCHTRIYWSVADNAYFEVFSKKRHSCPNRSVNNNKPPLAQNYANTSNTNRPYYSKKPWPQKPKMPSSNSIELITGNSFSEIQRKYEALSDIVINEFQGSVFGSQSHISNNILSIVIYFSIPKERFNEFKQRYNTILPNSNKQLITNNYQ